jgi:AbrB family looped-hinge helix DNA binding protein
MAIKTRIDGSGRLVIPKELREQYGLSAGTEVEILTVPDGIAVIPARSERRLVRHGRVVAVDTGAETASADIFDPERLRTQELDRAAGAWR